MGREIQYCAGCQTQLREPTSGPGRHSEPTGEPTARPAFREGRRPANRSSSRRRASPTPRDRGWATKRWVRFRAVLPLAAVLLLAAWGCAHTDPADVPIIDTHVHFWDVDDPQGIGWPAPGHPLYRSFLDRDFQPIASAQGVRATVLVQSGSRIYENVWTLKASEARKEFYSGVVGNLSQVIGTERFSDLFDECCRDPRYVGFRLSRGPSNEDFFTPHVREHLERLAERGKTLDLLMGGFTLKDVDRLARLIPRLKIMVNHGGGGPIDGGPPEPGWRADLEAAARNPNVFCKLSGFFDRAARRPAPRELGYYRSRLDLLWEVFGEDRLVFGSDWPVTELDGAYADYLNLIRGYVREKGSSAVAKVLHRNAARFYGLPPVEERR